MSTAAQLIKLYSDGVIDAEALNVALKSLPSDVAAQPAPAQAPLPKSSRAQKRGRQKANKKANKAAKPRACASAAEPVRVTFATPEGLQKGKAALRKTQPRPPRPTAAQLRKELRGELQRRAGREPAPDDVVGRYFVRTDRYVNDPRDPARYRLVQQLRMFGELTASEAEGYRAFIGRSVALSLPYDDARTIRLAEAFGFEAFLGNIKSETGRFVILTCRQVSRADRDDRDDDEVGT